MKQGPRRAYDLNQGSELRYGKLQDFRSAGFGRPEEE